MTDKQLYWLLMGMVDDLDREIMDAYALMPENAERDMIQGKKLKAEYSGDHRFENIPDAWEQTITPGNYVALNGLSVLSEKWRGRAAMLLNGNYE